jgi:hypothetical protein
VSKFLYVLAGLNAFTAIGNLAIYWDAAGDIGHAIRSTSTALIGLSIIVASLNAELK